jgi:glycerol-3-phosphate dehydrogenase (NAD(P)+)
LLPPEVTLVSLAKGVELSTLKRMSQVVGEVADVPMEQVAVVSGPNLAREIAAGHPTATVVACTDHDRAVALQRACSTGYFRPYTNTDLIGIELSGACKNVIALACGIASGVGLGENTAAAIITRGLAEITRLACAAGARRETLAGLTGLGDLVLTCTGTLSRNRHVGLELARGRTLNEVLAGMKMVAEGVRTTDAALALGARHGVELPIAGQVAELLAGRKDPRTAVYDLMLRPQRAET